MRADEQIAILVPDGAYPLVLSAFLKERTKSIGLRRVAFEIVKDAFRDSSREAVELLRPFQRQCSHALIIRDLHGSGWEDMGATELEERLKNEMIESGWNGEFCGAIVVEPEIEAWLRFDSSHLHQMIRDRARRKMEWEHLLLGPLIDGTIEKHGGKNSHGKPVQPKEAFEEILRYFGIQRSNALYGHLAGVESLKGCTVASFNRLNQRLRAWFPDHSNPHQPNS
jgi:hypothetical protein